MRKYLYLSFLFIYFACVIHLLIIKKLRYENNECKSRTV